jgi:hypothetical protein
MSQSLVIVLEGFSKIVLVFEDPSHLTGDERLVRREAQSLVQAFQCLGKTSPQSERLSSMVPDLPVVGENFTKFIKTSQRLIIDSQRSQRYTFMKLAGERGFNLRASL